MFVVNFDFS